MFEEGFATVRNFILEHSDTIVQDDAGIPLAYFNRDKWNIRLFGNYIGPIEIFKQHYQPKLQELYEQSNPPPLEFNFGYRWNYKESNLIVAQRNVTSSKAETSHDTTGKRHSWIPRLSPE